MSDQHEVGATTFSPYKIEVHRDWNPNVPEYDADIAILRLPKIHYTNHIQPICLWTRHDDPSTSVGTVVGWGQDKTGKSGNVPKMIDIPLLLNEDCWLEDHLNLHMSSKRTFCAGLKNGEGICFGDSGSGYVIKFGALYYLKGIVSSSPTTEDDDCDVKRYAIYTDVLQYKPWIQTNLETKDLSTQVSSGRKISSNF